MKIVITKYDSINVNIISATNIGSIMDVIANFGQIVDYIIEKNLYNDAFNIVIDCQFLDGDTYSIKFIELSKLSDDGIAKNKLIKQWAELMNLKN